MIISEPPLPGKTEQINARDIRHKVDSSIVYQPSIFHDDQVEEDDEESNGIGTVHASDSGSEAMDFPLKNREMKNKSKPGRMSQEVPRAGQSKFQVESPENDLNSIGQTSNSSTGHHDDHDDKFDADQPADDDDEFATSSIDRTEFEACGTCRKFPTSKLLIPFYK